MRTLIFIFAWLCLSQTPHAQATFSKVISNYPLDPENGWIIKETSGSIFMLSGTECLGQDILSCCTISKLDDEGNILWFKQYPFHPGAPNTMTIKNNRIFVCGHSEDMDSQFELYCLDLDGNVLWNKQFGNTTLTETFPRMVLTFDKHIWLYGARELGTAGMPLYEIYIVKTDMDGNQVAEYEYDFQNNQSLARTIIETTNHQPVFSYAACPASCFVEFTGGVANIDSLGNLNWNLKLPFAFQPDRPNVVQTDNNTLVVNWHHETTLPNHDLEPPTLFYLNLAGQVQDSLIFENQSLKAIDDLEAVWGKGLVGCGNHYIDYLTDPNPDPAGWVFRVDENKSLLWDRSFADTTQLGRVYTLQSIIPTSDGGYLAVGTIINNMTGVLESHNWVLKLDSLGCFQPACGPVNYVTDIEEAVFLKGKDILVFPNPANDQVNIQLPYHFELGKAIFIDLVSNTGAFIQRIKITSWTTRIDLSGVSPGVYFAIIHQGNEIMASKKILVGR